MQIDYHNRKGEFAHTVFRFATENDSTTLRWTFTLITDGYTSFFNLCHLVSYVLFGLIHLRVKPLVLPFISIVTT